MKIKEVLKDEYTFDILIALQLFFMIKALFKAFNDKDYEQSEAIVFLIILHLIASIGYYDEQRTKIKS